MCSNEENETAGPLDRKKPRPRVTEMWHDNEPSLFKGLNFAALHRQW
jgi:hypothetical protein